MSVPNTHMLSKPNFLDRAYALFMNSQTNTLFTNKPTTYAITFGCLNVCSYDCIQTVYVKRLGVAKECSYIYT